MANSYLRRLPGQPQTTWKNWAGNQTCRPHKIERPFTEAHVQTIVKNAAAADLRVRAVGSGHSFTAAACTDDVLVSLEHLNMVREIDQDNLLVTVDAGTELHHLNGRLAKAGLAMTNLGDVAYQTVAGAVSTGTHGTGLTFGGIATQLRGLRIVTATGDIVECSAEHQPELFSAARVGLGVFGIITQATIAVEPAFNVHAIEGPKPIEDVFASWHTDITAHDHFEFYWIPGTETAMTKSNRRTQQAIDPLSKFAYLRDKIVGENLGFGGMVKVGSRRPSLIPKMNGLMTSAVGNSSYTDVSHKVFTSPRWVKFVEMEYSVPVADLPTVLRRINDEVVKAGISLLFPIEARVAASDDIPLSTAYGRDSGYVAVHRAPGLDHRPYFEIVEGIANDFDGRPHWGKMHYQSAATLAPRYPLWDEFQRVRAEYDPTGRFANTYTNRVLG